MKHSKAANSYPKSFLRLISDMEIRLQAKVQTIRQDLFPYGTNHPYLSGDVFADMCDVKLNNKSSELSGLDVAKSIFIKGEFLEHFLTIRPELFRNKILVSGNSDTNFLTSPLGKSRIKALYGQNLAFSNLANSFTIPIGLENLNLQGSGRTKFHHEVTHFSYNNTVLVPPMGRSNPIRDEIVRMSKKKQSLFTVQTNRLPRRKYFNLTRDFRFILVLEGNGFDTHRLWEVLYQGSFPILFSTQWSRTLDYLKLPIFAIENLNQINEKSLSEFWYENKNFVPKQTEALWAPFWERRIREQVANE